MNESQWNSEEADSDCVDGTNGKIAANAVENKDDETSIECRGDFAMFQIPQSCSIQQ